MLRTSSAALLLGTLSFSAPAQAQCTVPNVLTNGQVADASEVMDNFYALATCIDATTDAAVTTTGAPQAGALAVFSSPKTIGITVTGTKTPNWHWFAFVWDEGQADLRGHRGRPFARSDRATKRHDRAFKWRGMNPMRKTLAAMLLLWTFAFSTPAFAQCTVPNVLTNGQVADASEVMDNFYAVATCIDATTEAAVTTTGAPQAGALAVFSSPETITSADLSGDITTSGGTVATLASSGVVPGTYINPTIVVDSKGRVTSAAHGPGGSGSPPALILIATHVADGTSGSVTFGTLPQSFRDLLVVITGQSVNPVQDLAAYANGDMNNANYRNFTWNRFGTGVVAAPRIGAFPGLGVPNVGSAAQIQAEFLGYSSSIWKKNAKCEMQYEDSPNFFRSICEWKWESTAPITQLEFRIASGNIANGTVFSLYGRGQS